MTQEHTRYAMSMDSIGRLGSVGDFLKVRPTNAPVWLEGIAFRPAFIFRRQVEGLEKRGFRFAEFHAGIGIPPEEPLGGKVRRWAIESQLLSVRELSKLIPGCEVLVHAPKARGTNWRKELSNRPPPSFIWIEIDESGYVGLMRAQEQVDRLRKRGIPSGIMVDVFHLIRDRLDTTKGNLIDVWTQMLGAVDRYSPSYISGFHIAHGHPFDSLPQPILQDTSMLRDLAYRITPSIRSVVFEDQWPGLRSLKLNRVNILSIRNSKYLMYQRCIEAGLLKLE